MTDNGLKSILSFVIRHKKLVGALMDRFDPNDIERGILSIDQDILNRDLKILIMEKADSYLDDYRVHFDNGSIFLDLNLTAKQLGKIKAKYMLEVEQFIFNEQGRSLTCSYREDVKSQGNFMQNMAFKAIGLKGSYLESAVELANLDFIQIDKDHFSVHLDKIDALKKIPSSLYLDFISCENGKIKLNFNL